MRKKVVFDQENFQGVQDHKMLCVLMSKDNLSPAEEDLKERLVATCLVWDKDNMPEKMLNEHSEFYKLVLPFIRHPCLVWDKDNMGRIMIACTILQNMIIEDDQDRYLHYYYPTEFLNDMPTNRQPIKDNRQPSAFSTERIGNLVTYMTNREQLRDRGTHNALINDLIEHIWQKFATDN